MDKTKYSNSKRKLAAIAMAAVIGVGGAGSAAVAMSSPSASSISGSAVVMDVDAASTVKPSKVTVTNCGNATVNFRLWTTKGVPYKLHIVNPTTKGNGFTAYKSAGASSSADRLFTEKTNSKLSYANFTSVKHFNAYNVSGRKAKNWTETLTCYCADKNGKQISSTFKIVIEYSFSGGSKGKTTVKSIKLK